ncbi:hypothetical protein N8703_03260 [Verrucomicrobia bacterium]|nr:hypothetical protein [Verrucomicrobiota bacterium]
MPTDLPIRESFRLKVDALAAKMNAWQTKPRIDPSEKKNLEDAVISFNHTTSVKEFKIGGVDGSGDYPSFTYADSFIYLASASGTVYGTDTLHGLKEETALNEPTLELTWLPEDQSAARPSWIHSFGELAGRPVRDVIDQSDYRSLMSKKKSVDDLVKQLILPKASDIQNVSIQLRTTAEMGTGLRLVMHEPACRYVLMDTTFSLPMVTGSGNTLFFEHLKRLCCVEALKRDIAFMTISKSHGFPSMDQIEDIVAEKMGLPKDVTAEHWFLRLPIKNEDAWQTSLIGSRSIPPVGAASYLFRFHRNTPVMRLDMDLNYWRSYLKGDCSAEKKLFEELDYTSHDQRAYGYPYAIKACHDRARLTMEDRKSIKKQIIDAAVSKGMQRAMFRDVSMATGHN